MITTLLFDFSNTLLFARDKSYSGGLNKLHKELFTANQAYNFWDYFELNSGLLSYLETKKDRYNLYIFTSGSVQNVPVVKERLDKIFKGTYSAEELNTSKKDIEAFMIISKLIKTAPREILFIDDDQQNLDAANSAGLNVLKYTNNTEIILKIDETSAKNN